jgi:hypothetical protein
MSNRCCNSRDSLERHKVKIAHTQRPRCECEGSWLDVGMGVQGAVHMDRRTPHTRIARRNGKIFGVSRTPPETVGAFRERGTTERRLAALQFGQIPQREARSVHRANTVPHGRLVRCVHSWERQGGGRDRRTCLDWRAAMRQRRGPHPPHRRWRAARRARGREDGAMRLRVRVRGLSASR